MAVLIGTVGASRGRGAVVVSSPCGRFFDGGATFVEAAAAVGGNLLLTTELGSFFNLTSTFFSLKALVVSLLLLLPQLVDEVW